MSDPILAELQEDLRREQLQVMTKKYGGIALMLAILVVLGTAGYTFYEHQHEAELRKVTEALYDGLGPDSKSHPAEVADKLQAFATEHADSAQAPLAKLLEAGLAEKSNQPDRALAAFEAVMNDSHADAALKGAATILYAQAGLESVEPKTLQDKLAPYQTTDSPYRFAAWELGALAAHRAGDHDKAQALLAQLTSDGATPGDIRQRAVELQRVL